MRSDYIERRFKMNRETTVIIKSRKAKDAEIYTNSITVTTETADIKPLQLQTRAEIEDMIRGIELEDDQSSLFPER